jgi:hypothetical protein
LLAFAQAPLTGAIIALPAVLGGVLHPLVTAFYGWSGCMDSMHGTALFDTAIKLNPTWFATPAGAMAMLLLHVLIGLIFILTGLRRR